MIPEHMIKDAVIQVLKTIHDPEIPVNIYDLGLIYDIQVKDGEVHVVMTLTSPNCPVAETLPDEVLERIKMIESVKEASVQLTFEPEWDESKLSDEAKLELGML